MFITIWIIISVILVIVVMLSMGYTGEPSIGMLLPLAMFWPFTLVFCLVILPFVGLYYAGVALREMVKRNE